MARTDNPLTCQDVIDACVAGGTLTAEEGVSMAADVAAGKLRLIVAGAEGAGTSTLMRSLA